MNQSTPKVQNIARGERILEERQRLGLTQTQLADAGGVSKGSQILYEKGNAPTADYLAGIATVGADIAYILIGTRSGASSAAGALHSISEQLSDPAEFAPIPLYSAKLAAGDGAANDGEQIIDHLAFRRDWLKDIGVSPQTAVIARARGDSMTPTLQHGDALLIDLARADPPAKVRTPGDTRPAQIYALVDDGYARVKRLELAAPGTLMLLSDNPAHAPEIRPVAAVSIIGRVMWWGHTNRE